MAPPDSGFGTDTDQLRRHAATIAGKAESVGTAAEAASHVADLDDAYGILCQMFMLPQILKGPQDRCAQMIKDAQQELHKLEKSITTAAKKYDEQEQELLDRLREVLEKLGRSGEFDSPGGSAPSMPTPPPPPGAPQPAPMPTPPPGGGAPGPAPMPTPQQPTSPPGGGTPQPAPMPAPHRPDGGVPPAPMPNPMPSPQNPQPAPMPNPVEPPPNPPEEV
ncbi:Excreted virulence factor EspC, type VII ESX diderm [Prauserella aidingensis]|uniref:type VII secretion target n=1 Tax=Prauserella aidingensis TaxID=387890 RepID=UPI0020A37578|nr:type VII secretion target [Prauserella aidingensis]MCP2255527.1 Excreted virulence factor EspC, type VII ESX diderm [Prauserella aidingensis]